MGLLYGRCRGVPRWEIRAEREWQDDDSETTSPHIMLVVCTQDDAKADELLFGELGSITQAIRNRLDQKEFEKTSLFPVYCKKLLPTVSIYANLTPLNC